MGKKLHLMTSFFYRMARTSRSDPSSPPQAWPWQYPCMHPETLSFRKDVLDGSVSSSCSSLAVAPDDDVEAVVRSVLESGSRLFFEPAGGTRLIVDAVTVPFEGGVASVVDSADPYSDFKASMAEMVAARVGGGVAEDWEWMEEMLVWYLKMNEKRTHGVIVGAFRDLMLSLAACNSNDNNTSSTFSMDPPRSSSFTFEEEDDEDAEYES